MMGEKTFQKAMTRYFNKYEYSNTTLDDFFENLQIVFNEDKISMDLGRWKEQWIMKAGLNEIEGKLSDGRLLIKQRAVLKEHGTLRVHVFKVAFYDEECKLLGVKQVRIEDVAESAIALEEELRSAKMFVLNYNDESYIKTFYDDA